MYKQFWTDPLQRITYIVSEGIGCNVSCISMLCIGLYYCVCCMCVPSQQVALKKLFHFATSHVFESEVAGKMCADMCAAASKVSSTSGTGLWWEGRGGTASQL